VDSLSVSGTLSTEYYTRKPNIHPEISFLDIVAKISTTNLPDTVNEICGKLGKDLTESLKKLPLDVQELFIEACILARERGLKENDDFRGQVLKYYSKFYKQIGGKWVSWFLLSKQDIIKCLDGDDWIECDKKMRKELEEQLSGKRKDLENNERGYYGIKDPQTGEFFIRDVRDIQKTDKRKLTTGKNCKTWGKGAILNLILTLAKLPAPDRYVLRTTRKETWKTIQGKKLLKPIYTDIDSVTDEDMRSALYWESRTGVDLCNALEAWFESEGLIVEEIRSGRKKK